MCSFLSFSSRVPERDVFCSDFIIFDAAPVIAMMDFSAQAASFDALAVKSPCTIVGDGIRLGPTGQS